MRLYGTASSLDPDDHRARRAVAVGVFDGLHLGHEAILERTRIEAAARGGTALVFSFEPTPKEFFAPSNPPARLTSFRERFERLEALGIEELFCPRFAAIRGLPAREFIDELLIARLKAKAVVVGADFRFGAGRSGTLDDLRAAGQHHGFAVVEVPPVFYGGRRVSSTAIREALAAGALRTARAMLGRHYSISGRVVRGLGLGKQLGFPTANVSLKRLRTPVDGIFAVRVAGLGPRPLDAVASVGTRPTIGGGKPLLEVLIFDFDRDIYGRYITVQFVERLREERHFADLPALQRQIALDCEAARAALAQRIA